jgi:hypothetical protein
MSHHPNITRLDARIRPKEGKKDRVELTIFVARRTFDHVNPDDLIETLNATLKRGYKKPPKKTLVQIKVIESYPKSINS